MDIERFFRESGLLPTTQTAYGDFYRYSQGTLPFEEWTAEYPRPEDFEAYLMLCHPAWKNSTQYHSLEAHKSIARFYFGKDHPLLRYRIRRDPPEPQRTLNAADLRKLFQSIDTTTHSGRRDLPLILVMVDAGLRAREVCSLKVAHCDFENRTLSVLGKGAKWRSAVFSEMTSAYLQAWMVERVGYARHGCETVFCSVGGLNPGTPLTPDGLRSVFRYLRKRSGVDVSPHVLRRTFATLAIRQGAPSRLVQVAGGWSNIEMVERYTQVLEPADFEGYFPTGVLDETQLDADHR